MPPDPVRWADTRSWLIKAAGDLRGAQIDLAADPPFLEDVVFHCQQAVEKALKAYLTFHDRPFRKTHSIEEIGEACLTFDPSLKGLVDEAVPLTEYAWAFRYPGEPQSPALEEAQAAFAIAQRLVAAVAARLPVETHPA